MSLAVEVDSTAVSQIRVDFADQFCPEVFLDYIRLRNWWYGKRHGLEGDVAPRDLFDDCSHVVLATEGKECIGGVRATVCSPRSPQRLPMEDLCPGLRLARIFPELSLESVAYAEFSKLIVARRDGPVSYRNDIASRLFSFFWGPSNPDPEVRYAFSLAPTTSSRIYRALANLHGLHWEAREMPSDCLPGYMESVGSFSIQAYFLDPERSSR